MKGFTRDHKFVPMTDYKKVTRKSRDPEVKTQGIKIERKKRFISENDIDRMSDLQINALFRDVEKNWDLVTENTHGTEGDGFTLVYRNKESPNHTFELHPLEDIAEAEPPEHPEDVLFNAWYWFPASDGKAMQSSPFTMSETGGYTRKDAIREFKKDFIVFDQEFSS